MAGLYLHIPFCKQACHYCDFHFSTDIRYRQEMVKALIDEVALRREYLAGESLKTIYFGGGTPSLLLSLELSSLLDAIQHHLKVEPGAEITLEANPDDLTLTKAKELYAIGVNRLSIGIQSFDDTLLHYLNRAHQSQAAHQCLQDAREAGFSNISLDLIYAMPGLSKSKWVETIQQALEFSPEHISTYSLTVEEKTVFGNWQKKGKLVKVDEETESEQFELLIESLEGAGYLHYEISNFGRPGFISRHNSSYWKQERYLGVGPGAHSFDGDSRQFNVRNNALYIKSLAEQKIPFEKEMLSRENKINEFILTGLRTMWGCDLGYLRKSLQDDITLRCKDILADFSQRGLVLLDRDILKLTKKGKLFADKIAGDLMA